MVKIGMMIGDRYEILEKIGTGGMSDVYKAKCHKLNRYVAIKVLKQEFSENANFVSKFRIEAQAAAGLMHPNIVNVYDVGEENGIYYIVMELVEGITLKKYIEKKARLSYKEAVSIAIQVSMGIEAAHRNHIIHRDIKPQNIIISKEGKVKVTDFGIAKAATSNTITSNVMGSVHYASPEQARGGYSDEKSDIYSLGITLFEMLTGRVPFNGETTVAIAIKHIQEEMPSPREYVPEIPFSVEQIVLKCCQKSPDRRYQSMGELCADLKQSLMEPDGDFVVDNYDADGMTRTMPEDVVPVRRRGRGEEYYEDHDEVMRLKRDTEPEYEQEEDDDGDDYDYNPKMERITTILAVLAGVVICGIIIFLLVRVFDVFSNDEEKRPGNVIQEESSESSIETQQESSGEENGNNLRNPVEMPNVVGWNLGDARSLLLKKKLYPQEQREESDEYGEGIVIRTDIEAGTMLEEGSTVTLIVSSGKGAVPIPETTGKTYEDAYTTLNLAGFEVKRGDEFSDTIPAGLVISQDPVGGTPAEQGSAVTLIVSRGSQNDKVPVPNVIGKSLEEAKSALESCGFVVATVHEVNHSEIAKGLVCYQSYSEGSFVAPGTTFMLHVSLGPGSYGFTGGIAAPSAEEAPSYVPGQEVSIVIVADNGIEVYNHTTSTFPENINFHGIGASGGTITFTYTATTEPGVTEQKSFTRRIEFTAE